MVKNKEKIQKTKQNNFNDKLKISAKVVDREMGMREFSNIRMIRVKSSTHTLLIMEDFMPVIGEIDKEVEFVLENETIKFEKVKGFYMHKKNQFYLLIDEMGKVDEAVEQVEEVQKEE